MTPGFAQMLHGHGLALRRAPIRVLQVNVGVVLEDVRLGFEVVVSLDFVSQVLVNGALGRGVLLGAAAWGWPGRSC